MSRTNEVNQCPNCQKEIVPGAQFCYGCGKELPQEPPADVTSSTPAPKATIVLTKNTPPEPAGTTTQQLSQEQIKKKNQGCLIAILLVFGFFMFIVFIATIFGPNADSYIKDAQEDYKVGNYKKAISNYKEALENLSNDSEDSAKRKQVIQAIKKVNVKIAEKKFSLAEEEYKKGNIKKAFRLIRSAKETNPDNQNFNALYKEIGTANTALIIKEHISKAQKAFNNSDTEAAVDEYIAAQELNKNDKYFIEFKQKYMPQIKEEVESLIATADDYLAKNKIRAAQGCIDKAEKVLSNDSDVIAAKVRVQQASDILNELGPKPENSSWDASVECVKDYMQQVLRDPDSVEYIEWSPVNKIVKGGHGYWVVRVKYRAKNGFGGYVIEEKVALIQNNQVVDMTDWGY